MKILIPIYFFKVQAGKITRDHDFALVKEQSRFDVRQLFILPEDHQCMEYVIN